MSLTNQQSTVLKRFARTVAAAGLAVVIVQLPTLFGLIPGHDQEKVVAAGVLTSALVAAEKWLRYGSDPGEGDSEETGFEN